VVGEVLLLGVDGGGTRCRARLCGFTGDVLGEGQAGAANMRFGLEEGFAAADEAVTRCFKAAGLTRQDLRVAACFALAGASDPGTRFEIESRRHEFDVAVFTTDAHAACVGAHRGADGGIVIAGTGSIGEAFVKGHHYRVGGWGFPLSDEGSGAWIGSELVRRVLWAQDGRIEWTALLKSAFERFKSDPHAIVRWMGLARPRDFASLAPLAVEHALAGDEAGRELMLLAAGHIATLASRLFALGAPRVAVSGGLAGSIEPWLDEKTRHLLVRPAADALTGAVDLARAAALSEAAA
jgi:glucosamine kinase